MQLINIPLNQIEPSILPRDRSLADADALQDLIRSITSIGLRQPIEVFGITQDDHHPLPYGLISGYRRLMAFRAMGRDTIPALCCNPADLPAAMAAMVAENEIRTQISPWEKGRLIVTLLEDDRFPDAGTAINAIYPSATRQQRTRLRGFYLVVDALERSALRAPESLSVARMDRLATAIRLGGASAIIATLAANATPAHSLALQWEGLRPVLNAIFNEPEATDTKPRRPRHSLTLRQGMTLTRARAPNGWIIRMTGPMAKSPGLVDDVFDLVEKWLQPKE